MATDGEIRPRWVLVGDELHDVSEFAHLATRSRPEVICPACQHSVILKLGKIRAHHYAHQPDEICITTQPETALHLNVKFYIYKQLLQTDKIIVEQKCTGGCKKIKKWAWLENWNHVEIEYAVDSFRPDITLIQNGQTIGAIEIAVTHYVQEAKKEYFNTQNIKWLEVEANESIYQGKEAWKAERPFPFATHHPQLDEWICDDCRERQEKEQQERLEAQRKAQARREYEEHNYTEIHAAKMVDFYFPSGKKHREVYFVMKEVKNDQRIKVWVKTEDDVIIAKENGPITEESLQKLKTAITRKLDGQRSRGAVVDDFMRWRRWVPGQKFVPRDTRRFPFRYLWSEQKRKWIFYQSGELEHVTSWRDDTIYEQEQTYDKELLSSDDTLPATEQDKEGTCIFCGKKTREWWFYDGATGMCRCKECSRKGLA